MHDACLAWADIDYAVTVKGFCRFQIFFGWTPCQENVVYTLYKDDRYLFQIVDKDGNVYDFSGGKNKQVDNTNLYSVIDQRENSRFKRQWRMYEP